MSQVPASSTHPTTLIRRARTGQKEALGQLLELHRAYLVLLARLQIDKRIQGKLSASDLVQETLFRAFRKIASYRGTASFSTWLMAIGSNALSRSMPRNLRATVTCEW